MRSARLEANPVSPRRQHRVLGDTRNPPTRRVDKAPLLFDTTKQKNLSKSVTEFFSKLRPSKRPERGNTIRPPPDSDEEHRWAEPRSPRPTASCRTKRSSSLGRYGPDTIPASRWNTPVTPPRRAQSVGAGGRGRRPITRDLFLAKRALRRQRHTLISSGDFLGVTGANPYTGEPDLITPPTSSDDAVVTSSSSPTTATGMGTGAGTGTGTGTSHIMEYQPEWELGDLRVTPIDLRRLADDCNGRRIPTGRVLELDDLKTAELWGSSQLCDLDSLSGQTDMILKACSMEGNRGLGQAFQSVCTRTITTTGFGHSRPRHRAVAHLSDGTLDGSLEAPRSRQALMPRALSQSTSPLWSTGTSETAYSNRPVSPGQMQLSVWLNANSPGPRTAISTSVRKKVGIGPLEGSPIPHPFRKLGADSDTTSPSTGRGRTAPGPEEKHSVKPNPIAAGTENRPPQREQPDWAMRKTMRKASGNPSPQDEADTHKSSPTSTRTSTSLTTTTAQPPPPGTARAPWQNQAAAETIARGAARTAFAHHRGGSGWGQQTRVPVSAPDPGPQAPHRARARVQAAGTRAKPAAKPGAGAETGSGQGSSGQGKGTGKGRSEGRGGNEKNGKEMGKDKDKDKEKDKEKGKEKGKANTADPNKIEAKRWARSAMLMLAKVVGAYWHVVSPVFDGESQLRKRIDKAQATRGDAVVCVLAFVFLFLAVSGGVWAIRGIVWFVKLLGKLGEVLGVVAGLHD
ncbi:hypothetical protein F5144DRAFT_489251 [Chaetomium tenue]|uniref:Uncharacterized protein n=1 Tax=Chaetomium tenue TaxID=1854479 RepID=A0ACB7P5X3_9PEZI|nr:hypothetical protein F5144DRAFT_489251 [Chaetomium globosum]